MKSNAIEFQDVFKLYKIQAINPLSWIKSLFTDPYDAISKDFWALQGVSFEVEKGSVLGIIGPNGAGKSTILKLLAGVTLADRGSIEINGKIAPLIELGAGFHPELTGRENIYLNGVLLGLSRNQVRHLFDAIVDFADLWEFVDTPVKKYSSGMFIRLGFSIAIHTSPDILLIDEVLSVGDEKFQRKCLQKFKEFRNAGKTAVLVSHDLSLISNVCDNLILLNHGKVIEKGAIDKAIGHYLTMVAGDIEGAAILKNERLVLIFSCGKISIFWDGHEVTKKWGGYASVLIGSTSESHHLWYESTRALWKCTTVSKNHIRCRGEFLAVPVVMDWDIEVSTDNVISWNITMELKESCHFERREANIMLSEKYTKWVSVEEKGDFPDDFDSRDIYNWDILHSVSELSMSALSEQSYPVVQFDANDTRQVGVIVNSSFLFRGRVLRYLDLNEVVLSPGVYNYFSGEIQVSES